MMESVGKADVSQEETNFLASAMPFGKGVEIQIRTPDTFMQERRPLGVTCVAPTLRHSVSAVVAANVDGTPTEPSNTTTQAAVSIRADNFTDSPNDRKLLNE